MLSIVALYKTFSGSDFVELSLESIYSFCSRIVMIHSNYSWTGEKGNLVASVVEKWKREHDYENKIIEITTDVKDQSAQYDLGLRYIKDNMACDYIMLIDTDEMWDKSELVKLTNHVGMNRDVPAFSVSLHTYIKSMFYRITPKEWCQPTVLVKSSVSTLDGIRGHAIKGKKYLEDVYMHHFTYVRFNEQDVMKKIYNTAATERVGLVDMNNWVENKWNKLPNATNFHTVNYATESWKGVRVVRLDELPEVVQNHPEVYERFTQ